MESTPRIEIFRPGTFTAMDGTTHSFTQADLAAAAAAYDPAVDQAPIVVGHPALDTPAHGWIERLEMDGDRLVAVPVDVVPAFADAVREKRYKKISASWYPPSSRANPKPGSLYLKHVGFFGAHPVAVKGLRHAAFSQEQADASFTIPDVTQKEPDMVQEDERAAEFAERATALDTRQADLDAREATIIESERKTKEDAQAARHAAHMSFAEGMVAGGKLKPFGKDKLVGLLDALDAVPAMQFGDAGELTPIDVFKEMLSAAEPFVSFGELAKDEGDKPYAVSFAAPAGYDVEATSLELHGKALAHQAAHPELSYIDAVKAVS